MPIFIRISRPTIAGLLSLLATSADCRAAELDLYVQKPDSQLGGISFHLTTSVFEPESERRRSSRPNLEIAPSPTL